MVEGPLPTITFSGFGLIFVVVGLYTANVGRKARAQSKRIAETETTQRRHSPAPSKSKAPLVFRRANRWCSHRFSVRTHS